MSFCKGWSFISLKKELASKYQAILDKKKALHDTEPLERQGLPWAAHIYSKLKLKVSNESHKPEGLYSPNQPKILFLRVNE